MYKLLAKASEFLAPNLKPEEELFLQWHNLVKELKRLNGNDPVSVEDTDIPLRLQWVFNLIQQDSAHLDSLHSADSTEGTIHGIGPCLEFAMRYKIFDWLVALAKEDNPAGFKSYVLFFLTNFVRAPSAVSLLSKSFIYKPLARLVAYCGDTRCSPWDREEMAFLQSVVDAIEKDPCLANLFLKSSLHDPADKLDADLKSLVLPQNPFLANHQEEKSTGVNGASVQSSGTNGAEEASEQSYTKEKFTFPLLNSLLRMALNPDPLVSSQARQAVIRVLHSREPVVSATIADPTPAAASLTGILIGHLHKLYMSIPSSAEASSVLLHNAAGDLEHVVRSYTQWVTFVDQIAGVADSAVTDALQSALKSDMTSGGPGFSEDWLSSSPEKNSLALAAIIRTYKTAESTAVLSVLSDVILDGRIFGKFLQLISETDLMVMAFDLLDVMIQKPSYHFVEEAFLLYLESRMYIRKEQRMQDIAWATSDLAEAADRAAMFRDLFPTAAKSCTATEEERDCESYMRESHYSMTRIVQRCKDLKWPAVGPLKSCNVLLAEESSFFDGQAFNEGPVLRLLFSHLNNLLSQPYVLNLRITGILSKICLIPHPCLREYLLDPTIPLAAQCSSLYRCLVNLVQQIDSSSKSIPDFQEKLVQTRQAIRNGQWQEKCQDAEGIFLCGVITVEEFCKEIAARASVRFTDPLDK
ncbi:putative Protein FAM160B1 [Hypsibius exemplaris]|uniref:FHF complex subunit HOOK-interacting protein C-terminal domain-containing protein n=1 Tax=Hypsibius exemplaris TaxID=2072580 RepID=A0A9X6NC65_HYPEX|nr:putative Protein FAM160B1 [Hypsibius exemplaris]